MKQFTKIGISKVQFLDQNAYSEDEKTWYPSVTTVLSGGLPKSQGFYEWLKLAGESANKLATAAMDKGSRIHEAIENLILGNEIDFSWVDESGWHEYEKDEWIQINKFVEFHNRFKPEYAAPEQSFISHSLKVGGTIDIICKIDNERWILDIKTGKDLYDDYALQLAAYKYMFAENTKEQNIRYGILWLNAKTRTEGKKGTMQGHGWQVKEFTKDYQQHIKIFKNVRENFDYLNPNWKPFNQEYPVKLKLS